MSNLVDPFCRAISYLRLSITDHCNLRCVYCMPEQGMGFLPMKDHLTYDEVLTIVRAGAPLGLTKVRITGGEPLVRKGVAGLVHGLSRIVGVDDIALSTNGLLLKRYARELREAGLKRVNVSLDTLRPERFQRITRWGRVGDILEGIEEAKAVGLDPVKVNVVVMRGVNDDELVDLARLSFQEGWHIRFIELMPFVEAHCSMGQGQVLQHMSTKEVMERIQVLGTLEPARPPVGNGPARYYRFPGARGTIGFISPLTELHFCSTCNRLRLTADGKLRPCLLTDLEVDMRSALRGGASLEEVQSLFRKTLDIKPESHGLRTGRLPERRFMVQIGG